MSKLLHRLNRHATEDFLRIDNANSSNCDLALAQENVSNDVLAENGHPLFAETWE